jgi:O-antigen/teichoic acid export membrane protein
VLGGLVALVTAVACSLPACIVLKLFPQAGRWGRVSWQNFRELFNYGKDVFLVAVGAQLIMASQVIIITRMLGPESAGVWGTGLRLFNLLNQVIWRVSDMSGSAFAEMLARGEIDRLCDRYRSVAILTFSLAGWAAVSFALCNSLFVPIWTHGKIHWPVANDWLLAVWMILLAVVHCHNCFILLTKQVGFMRYIYFLEGVVFVALSFLVARWGGLSAIIGCSILCAAAFSGAYGIRRVHRFFGIPLREVAVGWLRPMGKVLLFYLPAAGLTWWLLAPVAGVTRLGANALMAGSLGAYLFFRFGIPIAFRTELLRRVPARVMPLLKRLFLQAHN